MQIYYSKCPSWMFVCTKAYFTEDFVHNLGDQGLVIYIMFDYMRELQTMLHDWMVFIYWIFKMHSLFKSTYCHNVQNKHTKYVGMLYALINIYKSQWANYDVWLLCFNYINYIVYQIFCVLWNTLICRTIVADRA
jgi:hypothetical protein